MSSSQSARKTRKQGGGRAKSSKKVRRKSPLETLASAGAGKVNTLKRRGYFAGREIAEADRMHLEPKELKAFFNRLPKTSYWYPYFFIQYFFGCRLSEPALILDEDVNLQTKQIIIRRLKKQKEIEGYREHVYTLDSRVIECVKIARAWKEHRGYGSNPFLFASSRQRNTKEVGAERLSQLRNLDGQQAVSRFTAHRVFRRIGAEIKLPEPLLHSQVLRHTRAVIMLASGASVEQVQYLLGHSSLKMTQRYLGVAEGMKTKNKVDAKLVEMGLGL